MQATTIGLDIAKSVFQVHGVGAQGRVVLRRRLARGNVLAFFANLPPCRVGLEACGGAHYWARQLRALGHDARLMPPQYVKAYVKTNQHDAADAEACSARRAAPTTKLGAGRQARVQRPSMRFVPVKTEAQQATLMLRAAPRRPPRSALGARRGVRDQLIGQRTASINALRGHLAELGVVAAQRRAGLQQLLAVLGDLEDRRIPPLAREVLAPLVTHIRELEAKLADLDRRLVETARTDPITRSLVAVALVPSANHRGRRGAPPGVGPVIATAVVATVADAKAFRSGRHLAACAALQGDHRGRPWEPAAGLVPRQRGTGGKERLLGISKRGDAYLRRQLIPTTSTMGAGAGAGCEGPHRQALRAAPRRPPRSALGARRGVDGLLARRPFNMVVARRSAPTTKVGAGSQARVANKLARIIWAMLVRGEAYRAA